MKDHGLKDRPKTSEHRKKISESLKRYYQSLSVEERDRRTHKFREVSKIKQRLYMDYTKKNS